MAKTRSSELIGQALDWAVAKCEEDSAYRLELRDRGHDDKRPFMRDISPSSAGGGWWPRFSTDWTQGGPIIEREKISTSAWGLINWKAITLRYSNDVEEEFTAFGETPLIASMRCYVASKLGDEVEIPEGLM